MTFVDGLGGVLEQIQEYLGKTSFRGPDFGHRTEVSHESSAVLDFICHHLDGGFDRLGQVDTVQTIAVATAECTEGSSDLFDAQSAIAGLLRALCGIFKLCPPRELEVAADQTRKNLGPNMGVQGKVKALHDIGDMQ